ncbi:MAG: hypothetical protein AMXMBFR84_47590 [Candidatus Hydrogenedentota bacterium]
MEYRVTWNIDLDADSPEEAASQALAIHRNTESWATHFEVRDKSGRVHEVDLGYPSPEVGRVHVLVPMEDGIVRGVEAFRTAESATKAEQEWLRAAEIYDEKAREHRSDWGTGAAVWECELQD